EAGDVGGFRLAEDAGRADHVAGVDAPAARGLDAPQVRVLVERSANHPGVQPDAVAQAVLVDAVLRVRLQLAPGRVHTRPVAALLERELVAEGGDVDGDPRVGVPVPGASHPVSLLQHHEVREPGLVELHRGPDAREAGADHNNFAVNCDIRSTHIFKI